MSISSQQTVFQEYEPGQRFDNKYEIISKLARGGTASLYLVDYDGQTVVMKHANCLNTTQSLKLKQIILNYLKNEISVYKLIAKYDHPHFLRFIDSFKYSNRDHLIIEYFKGETLDEKVKKNPKTLTDNLIRKIINSSLKAIYLLHHLGFLFRDFHPGQLIFGHNEHGEELIKVIDLGAVIKINEAINKARIVGIDGYNPPEIYANKIKNKTHCPYYPQSDICKVGYLAIELITKTVKNPNIISINPLQFDIKGLPTEYQDFIQKTTNTNIFKRYDSIRSLFFSYQNLNEIKIKFIELGLEKILYNPVVTVGSHKSSTIVIHDQKNWIERTHFTIKNKKGNVIMKKSSKDSIIALWNQKQGKWDLKQNISINVPPVTKTSPAPVFCLGFDTLNRPISPMIIKWRSMP